VVIGAGGIGFDVAEFLTTTQSPTLDLAQWQAEWGVCDPSDVRGGLALGSTEPEVAPRQVTLLQRKTGKLGKGLGKTTGWIHRATLQKKGVKMIGGVQYDEVTPQGLWVAKADERHFFEADTIVICAGQIPNQTLAHQLQAQGLVVHVIGGADVASELDAKRAIDQGARLAARL
jgi:2,4-dienoyl-CoA reductase (NADPH2)